MKPWIAATIVLALAAAPGAQTSTATPPQEKGAGEDTSSTTEHVFPASVAGRWASTVYEEPLDTELHRSVYGAGARSRRQVALTIRPTGDGTFTVTSSVRDRSGRTVAGTREVIELRFTLGDLKREQGLRPRYTSRIAHAERRYPDDPGSTFAFDGARLEFLVPDGQPTTLDVRFETPEGRGSFWETLRRARATTGAPRS